LRVCFLYNSPADIASDPLQPLDLAFGKEARIFLVFSFNDPGSCYLYFLVCGNDIRENEASVLPISIKHARFILNIEKSPQVFSV
jgi:hypothetical protein